MIITSLQLHINLIKNGKFESNEEIFPNLIKVKAYFDHFYDVPDLMPIKR